MKELNFANTKEILLMITEKNSCNSNYSSKDNNNYKNNNDKDDDKSKNIVETIVIRRIHWVIINKITILINSVGTMLATRGISGDLSSSTK